MYTVRWLLLLTLVMSVRCEYQPIGCYLSEDLDARNVFEVNFRGTEELSECIDKCDDTDAYDTAMYSDETCYCSSIFNPPEHADIEVADCAPSRNIFNVGANLVQDCSPGCAVCTPLRCIRCDSTHEFDDLYNCVTAGDACTSSPCGDVCTLDPSAPDGFTCSCSDNSQYLDDNNDCQACTTISPNCLQCSNSIQCSQCSGIFVVDANGNCEAQSPPDDLVASINGDPHVLIKNGDAADPSQYFCFDIVALPDHQYVTILEDSTLKLQIYGDLIGCGDEMSCLSEITIVHDGTTLTFYDDDNIELGDNPTYTWESITELVTVGTITIQPNDPGRQKTVSINIGDHLLYYNVHFLQLSSFSYLGIMFLNDHYSQTVTGAIGKFIGEEFSTELTVGSNVGALIFTDPTFDAAPLSVRRTSRYNPHTLRTVQCDFHENPDDELVAGFIHANHPTA